jgi:SPP1 family predicted phage head-tail adaptor
MARDFSNLNTRIQILGTKPNEGPEPGEEIEGILHECWAGVESVRFRDFEQAKANNTLSDINIFIRDTRGSFVPTNKHSLIILDSMYEGRLYNIKDVQPDLKEKQFITIVAGMVT